MGQIRVKLRRHDVGRADPLRLFAALQDERGNGDVYLLESPTGPEADRERAILGLDLLACLEIAKTKVSITGRLGVCAALHASIRATGRVDDDLHLFSPHDAWTIIRAAQNTLHVEGAADDRPDFGWLAVLGYDAVHSIENLARTIPAQPDTPPEFSLYLYSAILDFDLRRGTCTLIASQSSAWAAVELRQVTRALANDPQLHQGYGTARAGSSVSSGTGAPTPGAPLSFECTEQDYIRNAQCAQDLIDAGDIYQVQLGYSVCFDRAAQPLDIYRWLRQHNPSPYMGLVPLRHTTLISASPELHVRLASGVATMRPIAGTAPRTGDPADDARALKYLSVAAKEHAEHVMLVDLCRNDLGRVAVPGSVEVPVLMKVEPYSHVYHLVSTVTANIEPPFDILDVLRATFPAGTMTGAPKVRAMEVIEDMETSRRGLYAGVFGFIGTGGYANLALTIRTVFQTQGTTTTRASAGIVADSVPGDEWAETRAKLAASMIAISSGQAS